jgi:hypothetical protein
MNDGTEKTTQSQVWKYAIINELNVLSMPKGAIVLNAGFQVSFETSSLGLVLWAEVDPTAEKETRVFRIFNSGEDIPYFPAHRRYLTTVGTPDGMQTVGHIYEILNHTA